MTEANQTEGVCVLAGAFVHRERPTAPHLRKAQSNAAVGSFSYRAKLMSSVDLYGGVA